MKWLGECLGLVVIVLLFWAMAGEPSVLDRLAEAAIGEECRPTQTREGE